MFYLMVFVRIFLDVVMRTKILLLSWLYCLYLMCGTYYNFNVGKIRETNIRETNILFSYLLQQYKIKYYNK